MTLHVPDALAKPEQHREEARPPWPWAAGTILLLLYLVWAGSSYDPRHVEFTTFNRNGWLTLAPGLGQFWIASTLVFGWLSALAYRALRCTGGAGRDDPAWRSLIAAAILLVALEVRLLVLRAWVPLPLEMDAIGPRTFHPPGVMRWPLLLADMLTIALLLLAQIRLRQSLWLAAAYAFHPLAIAGVGYGFPMVAAIPVVVAIAALGWRLRRWVQILLIVVAAVGCVIWVWHESDGNALPFNGLLSTCLAAAGIDRGPWHAGILTCTAAVMEGAVFVAAVSWRWDLARAWGHVLVVWALISPRVMPGEALLVLALVPLAWNSGGWVLSLTALWTYAMAGFWRPGNVWEVPGWLVLASLLPVAVIEIQSLAMEFKRGSAARMS